MRRTLSIAGAVTGALAAFALIGVFVFAYIAVFTPGRQVWLQNASGVTFALACTMGAICPFLFMGASDLEEKERREKAAAEYQASSQLRDQTEVLVKEQRVKIAELLARVSELQHEKRAREIAETEGS